MLQPPLSNPWDTTLRLVYAIGSSILWQVPGPLTLVPKKTVERLEASGFNDDNNNHNY